MSWPRGRPHSPETRAKVKARLAEPAVQAKMHVSHTHLAWTSRRCEGCNGITTANPCAHCGAVWDRGEPRQILTPGLVTQRLDALGATR